MKKKYAYVYNKSKQLMEYAEQKKCPRCKGFGAIACDDGVWDCYLCNGYGRLWLSDSGWSRALRRKLNESQLY